MITFLLVILLLERVIWMESIEFVLSGCRKILMSYSADGIKRPAELVPESEQPICIVVGAIAKVITPAATI